MKRVASLVLLACAASVTAYVAARSCGEANEDPARETTAQVRADADSGEPVARRRTRERVGAEGAAPDVQVWPDDWPVDDIWTSGTVVWPGGSPAADALVLMGDLDDTDDVQWTDASGRFGFDTMAHYSDVNAFAVRDGDQWRGSAPVDGWPIEVTVELHRSAASETVRFIHVRGYDGGVIDGAVAEVVAGRVRVPPRFWSTPVKHAANGWFLVVPERWEESSELFLLVHSARDSDGEPLPYGSVLVEVPLFDDGPLELKLPPGHSVSGTVVDPSGTPVADVTVEMKPAQPDGFDKDHMDAIAFEAKTNKRGEFTFHGLLKGPFTVFAHARQGRHGGSSELVVTDRSPLPALVLRPEIDVRIRVMDPEGVPIPGAKFSAQGIDARPAGADGVIRLEHVPQGRRIWAGVAAEDFTEVRLQDWRPTDGETREVTLAPARSIHGVVLGPDGATLRNVLIRVEGAASGQRPRWTGTGFALDRLPVGTSVRLWLRDGDRDLPYVTATAGDQNVIVRWTSEDRFAIYVDSGDAHSISLRSGGEELARSDGWAALVPFHSALLPPTVDVLIGPDDDGNSALLRDVAARGFRRVRLQRGADVRVRVTVPDDVDIRRVRCRALSERGFVIDMPYVGHSAFARAGLPVGTYVITFNWPGDGGTSERTVRIEDNVRLEIDLSRR